MRLPAPLLLMLSLLAPATAGARPYDLRALIESARRGPKVQAARAQVDSVRAKQLEVDTWWVPRLEVTAAGGPSSEIRCVPSEAECIRTEPSETRIGFAGAFFHIDARAFLPLFTFGKISAGQRAAAAGVRAADALVQAASADVALDAAKAYWGAKLARESLLMLDEGMGELDAEIARVEKALDQGKGDVTESDRHRLRAVRAEVEVRVAEAKKGERLALAGVRFLTGEDDADVDDAPFEATKTELVEREVARRLARERRPETHAADQAVAAAKALTDVEKARWWPDLVGLAEAKIARSSSADDPENAFYNDPLNASSFTAGVALRWTLEPGARVARVRGARADEVRALATAKMASDGVAADADRAWGEAQDAADRLAATRRGEKEARAWLVTVLQSAAAGLGEPKDVADALLLYFTLRGRTLQAIFDWNVAVVAVQRATGNP